MQKKLWQDSSLKEGALIIFVHIWFHCLSICIGGLYWIDISSCHPSIPIPYTYNAIMNSVSWILERTNVYGNPELVQLQTSGDWGSGWRGLTKVSGWFSAYTDLGQHTAQETLTFAEERGVGSQLA